MWDPRIYSGFNQERMKKDFAITRQYGVYRHRGIRLSSKENHREEKNRKPLEEIVYLEKYGNKLDSSKIA